MADVPTTEHLIDSTVDARPKRGHVKGDRLRAVPADWNRRGAVGA